MPGDHPRVFLLVQITLALALGGLAYWLSQDLLETERHAMAESLKAQYSPAPIVVAGQDLPAGTRLQADHLAVAESHNAYLPMDIVHPDDFPLLADRRLRHAVPAGKPVLLSYLEAPVTQRFSELVGPGERAITLDVDARSSIEGMLQVGDLVDLLIQDSQAQLSVLAEAAPIVATGILRSAHTENYREAMVRGQSEYVYDTITVILPSAEAVSAMIADSEGQLRILLRAADDEAALPLARRNEAAAGAEYFSNSQTQDRQLVSRRIQLNAPERTVQKDATDAGVELLFTHAEEAP